MATATPIWWLLGHMRDIGGLTNAGAINVFFGSGSGFNTALSQQMWHDEPVAWDEYGAALALADFDADGFDDLAIGVPYRSFEWDGDLKESSRGRADLPRFRKRDFICVQYLAPGSQHCRQPGGC